MNKSLTARIKDLLQRRQLKGTLTKIALTLSCMSIFLITYMLVAPVLTQEWEVVCGMEEHVHTDECYTLVPAELAGTGHKHTDECYTLVPAEPDEGTETAEPTEPGHQHTDACYAPAETGHQHTDACYEEVPAVPGHHHTSECYREVPAEPGHQHTDACYEEIPEVTGHQHSDGCYTEERGDLNCSQDEHSHSDGCYDEEGNLTCGMSEHSHDDSCYGTDRVLSCGQEESEGRPAERKLICGQEESEGREAGLELICGQEESEGREAERKLICGMTESVDGEPAMVLICGQEETDGQGGSQGEDGEPEMVRKLTCGLKETEGQDESQGEDGEAEMVRVLTCGLEEHVHTDQCYHKAEESAFEYICGFLTEHTHNEDCYFESGELKCTLEEHTHDESCLPRQKPERAEGPIFPAKPPEGYKEAEVFDAAGMMMFAMSGDEDGNSQAGIQAAVYIPEDAFSEEVVFVPQPLFEDDEAYATAAATLENAGETYESMPAAMDLSFVGTESYETLEPEAGPVYVRLEIPAEFLTEPDLLNDEDAEVTLWHHIEDDVEAVEKFYFDYTDGMLTVEFATNSFSTYTLTIAADTLAEGNVPVTWGTTVPEVKPVVGEDGSTRWDVSTIQYRYLDIPVSVNVSGLSEGTTITLPYTLEIGEAGRNGYQPTYKETGATGDGWSVEAEKEDNKVTIRINSSTGGHNSIDIYYRFDCWNVVSNKSFMIICTVTEGGEGHGVPRKYNLTGSICTGNGGSIIPYANESTESIYAFNALGGADKQSAYILAWSEVYETYFGLKESDFNNKEYIYDIAAYEVEPKGQQPYSISGTFTPDQNGKLISAVYMMDSAKNPDKLCLKSIDNSNFKIDGNDFTIDSSALVIDGQSAVVSKLEDETDHKTYTLYFLVKYPRASLEGYEDIKDWEGKVIDKKVKLNATLTLKHTGVDSKDVTTISSSENSSFCCYDGASEVNARIYWASYVSTTVGSSAGLSMLKDGKTATVEYSADFFCLNEARGGTDNNPYKLVAIIDLSYLTNKGKQQLQVGDYRFSGFNLSLIDAPGSWSQNTTNTPNVGWTEDKYGATSGNSKAIKVYGSTSLTGNEWAEVAEVPAAKVWALDQDRAFRMDYTPIDGKYVRLKVEYESQWTTALRVGYQMELQPGIVNKYNLGDVEELNLTNWFNYGGYKTNEQADLDYFVFQRYPVDDSTPAWANYDGTIKEVREYDNASSSTSGLPGYNQNKESWDVGYSLRNFAKTTLGSSQDTAGMLVTQALYDSNGNLIGNPTSIDPVAKDSYSLKTDVANVSEIVYNIMGAVTNGASSLGDLQERIKAAGENSPYKSLKMRYYVLLPDGLKLNTNPDNGEKDENGAPRYHFWTEGTTEYLSANSAFYNNDSSKVVQGGQTDVPTSKANFPNWKDTSANGNLSEMYWVAGGAVRHDTDKSKGQLYVFERTLGNWVDYDRFNMWGDTETYFWGRGLSFSVVPTNGTGTLPAGTYTPKFWCQFLDDGGNPISLENFAKGNEASESLEGQESDTLLYIPISFNNKHHEGGSDGEIKVEIDRESTTILADGTSAVNPEGSYTYPLTYKVDTGSSKNVVLWCNIEEMSHYDHKSEWHGTVTGVDLKGTGAKVYVRTEAFAAKDYEDKAEQSWLTDESCGWKEVTDLDTYDWSTVKAIAFSFEGKTFTANDTATVCIKMKAPEDKGISIGDTPKEPGKDVYTTYNELLISDVHVKEGGGEDEKACYWANCVSVPMKVSPVTPVLPSTGGKGTTTMYTTGLMLLIAAAGLMYQTKRRGRRTRKGGAT